MKEEEENILRSVVEKNVDIRYVISRDVYGDPDLFNEKEFKLD